jgi:hypothetical protein
MSERHEDLRQRPVGDEGSVRLLCAGTHAVSLTASGGADAAYTASPAMAASYTDMTSPARDVHDSS